jgi:hypothetical protein
MMAFLYLPTILSVIFTLIISQVAKKKHGVWSVKHLKWALANSASFSALSLLMVLTSGGVVIFGLGIVLVVGFAAMGAFEGLMLRQQINRQRKAN